MAILVKVQKVKTNEDLVTYCFYKDISQKGTFLVNSRTGALHLISAMPEDTQKIYFARAARKVMTEWKKDGKLPEKTFWAS